MRLVNAIYFNAAWSHPFEERLTRDGVFHLLGGGAATVPMMKQTERLRYTEGEGYQAVELPYKGGKMAMVILLPDAGQFREFEDALDAERVDGIVKALAWRTTTSRSRYSPWLTRRSNGMGRYRTLRSACCTIRNRGALATSV